MEEDLSKDSKGKKYANDRAPDLEEAKKILNYPDRRIKPVALIMESSGCRIGAFEYLKWDISSL